MQCAACCGLLLGILHGLVSLDLRASRSLESPGSALVGVWAPDPAAGARF